MRALWARVVFTHPSVKRVVAELTKEGAAKLQFEDGRILYAG